MSTDPESVPKRTRVVEFYTAPPSGSTVICADEPGLVIPRTLKAAVNLLVGRDWLTGPLGRKEHASQRSTTGLNELSLTGFWGAKRGANDHRFRPASSHVQPWPERPTGTSGHIQHYEATL